MKLTGYDQRQAVGLERYRVNAGTYVIVYDGLVMSVRSSFQVAGLLVLEGVLLIRGKL